jgi:hypothetical protein
MEALASSQVDIVIVLQTGLLIKSVLAASGGVAGKGSPNRDVPIANIH